MNRKVAGLLIGAAAVAAVVGAAAFGASTAAALQSDASTTAAAQTAPAPKWDAPARGGADAPAHYGDSGQEGILVDGEGRLSVAPDLALISLGVETTAATVADANGRAAAAMDALLAAVRASGVKDKDIQTRHFNIYPQYDYVEETLDGRRTSRQALTGYRVSNSANVKLRDLDSVGDVIDAVVTAGGDDVRINNISFTLEDTKPLLARLREMAVRDAMSKARHLATLSGVNLGRLVYIRETSSGSASVSVFAESRTYALAAASAAPPIESGEVDVWFSVQARFAIY